MTTGVEHYRASTRLAADAVAGGELTRADMIALAQVHATLAVAAATALGHVTEGGPTTADRSAWIAAASEHPAYQRRIREDERGELAETGPE
jgi:hypothetical protein